jgi:hypothetical protein
MAKHTLSVEDKANGIRKALASRRTPSWLKPSMRRYLKKIERESTRKGNS